MTGRRTWMQADLLGQVRALHRTQATFEALLDDAVAAAVVAGVSRIVLAEVLGVHRATFYRRFGDAVRQAESLNVEVT